MPAFGIDYLNQRLLLAEDGRDPAILARRWLWMAARTILLSLGAAAAVRVLLRISVHRLSNPPRQLAVDLGGGQPTIGTLPFSLGLSFLGSQIPDFAWAGIVLGLILAGAGAPFLIRRVPILSKDDGRAARGYRFLGLALGQRSQPLPRITRVNLEGGAKQCTEAFALQLWLKEGVGDNGFPEDFGVWWARWRTSTESLPRPPSPLSAEQRQIGSRAAEICTWRHQSGDHPWTRQVMGCSEISPPHPRLGIKYPGVARMGCPRQADLARLLLGSWGDIMGGLGSQGWLVSPIALGLPLHGRSDGCRSVRCNVREKRRTLWKRQIH